MSIKSVTKQITVTQNLSEVSFDSLVCNAASLFYIIHPFRGYAKEALYAQ